MEVRLARQFGIAAGKRGATTRAKAALDAGRRFILCDHAACERNGIVREGNEHRSRRATMAPAALAVTPEHLFGLPGRLEVNVAAQTATLIDFGHGALRLIASYRYSARSLGADVGLTRLAEGGLPLCGEKALISASGITLQASWVSSGSKTLTKRPCGSRLLSATPPPWASSRARTMESPRPAPP